MPLGKSGQHYYSPHEMQRKGDDPGASDTMDNSSEQEDGGEQGDGNHHHEIINHDDGTAHSIHTDPDGMKEEADHASYDEARNHMDALMGHGDDQEQGEEVTASDDSGSDDLAGMYSPGK